MGKATILTTKQICAGFGISHVTAYNWRQGSKAKEALPIVPADTSDATKAREVRFDLTATKAWAKANGLPFNQTAALAATAAKTGPKPASKPATAPVKAPERRAASKPVPRATKTATRVPRKAKKPAAA